MRVFGGVLLTLMSVAPEAHAAQTDPLRQAIADVDELRSRYAAPGMSVAVVRDGEVILLEGLGHRDAAEQVPVGPDTLFQIGSVTKPMTAQLVGSLELDPDQLAVDAVEELRFANAAMNQTVTLGDLMSHNSGIGGVDGTHVFFPHSDLEAHMARLPWLAPEGSVRGGFGYSNMGYAVLRAAIEQAGEAEWEQLISERLFGPLAMERSLTGLAAFEAAEDRSLGFAMFDGVAQPVILEDQYEAIASGGVASTARDMASWVMMALAEEDDEKVVVPRAFVGSSFDAHNMINPLYWTEREVASLDAYGWGWFVSEYEGRYRANHGGNVAGFSAWVDMLPAENLGVVVLTNQQSSELTRHAVDIVYRAILGLERQLPADYPVRVGAGASITKAPTGLPPIPKEQRLEYVGSYYHPGYGRFDVIDRDAGLEIRFPAFGLALDHSEGETFVTRRDRPLHQNVPDFPVTFRRDDGDRVIDAAIPFQSEPVIFERLED